MSDDVIFCFSNLRSTARAPWPSQQSEEIEIKMGHKNPNMVDLVFEFFYSIIPENIEKGGFEEDDGPTPHVQARVFFVC